MLMVIDLELKQKFLVYFVCNQLVFVYKCTKPKHFILSNRVPRQGSNREHVGITKWLISFKVKKFEISGKPN